VRRTKKSNNTGLGGLNRGGNMASRSQGQQRQPLDLYFLLPADEVGAFGDWLETLVADAAAGEEAEDDGFLLGVPPDGLEDDLAAGDGATLAEALPLPLLEWPLPPLLLELPPLLPDFPLPFPELLLPRLLAGELEGLLLRCADAGEEALCEEAATSLLLRFRNTASSTPSPGATLALLRPDLPPPLALAALPASTARYQKAGRLENKMIGIRRQQYQMKGVGAFV